MHDWGSRDATFLRINKEVLERLPEIVNAEGTHVTVPMQGSGTFAVEAMLTTFVPRDGQGAAADQRRLRPARQEDLPDRRARGSRCTRRRRIRRPISPRSSRMLEGRRGHHARVRRALRDDERHPESDRRDRRAGGAAWAPAADRCHERLRRAAARCRARRASTRSPPPPTSASRACRASASSSAARRRWPRPRATPPRWCSICTISGRTSPRPGNTASRRRST